MSFPAARGEARQKPRLTDRKLHSAPPAIKTLRNLTLCGNPPISCRFALARLFAGNDECLRAEHAFVLSGRCDAATVERACALERARLDRLEERAQTLETWAIRCMREPGQGGRQRAQRDLFRDTR